MYRTHTCGELNEKHIETTVQLAGWVNSRRDHGVVIFIDIRDRYGITQCTFDTKNHPDAVKIAETVRAEYVIQVTGIIQARPKELINPLLTTGAIELSAHNITILTTAKTPPFEVAWVPDKKDAIKEESVEINEGTRLTYRYLDLRRQKMLKNIDVRYHLVKYIRDYLHTQQFFEIETPILTKSTPEGARDYIVPSRIHPHKFYALPQSPQQYKQLLMVGGIDRYFQIARCFRDEDQRGSRQPEFTQLDIEMSFVERDDVIQLLENTYKAVFKQLNEQEFMNKKFVHDKPWPRLTFNETMMRYGSDKPDIRFSLEIEDISSILKETSFQVFSTILKQNGVVRAINASSADILFSRKDIDDLTAFVQELGTKGLAYIRIKKDGQNEEGSKEILLNNGKKHLIHSPIAKFLTDSELGGILTQLNATPGDIIFFGAGERKVVEETLGCLRLELGKKLNLIDKDKLAIVWIVDFPLFEQELQDGHYAPSHHMFTSPAPEDIPLLDTDPFKVRSWQYDLAINGYETAGGSIRIHDPKIQEKIFELVGFSEARKKEFAHMLEAFTYGVPPHGGIASGIERVAMLLTGEENIREVMAFPKNQNAEDLMMSAPSHVEKKQLDEAHIALKK